MILFKDTLFVHIEKTGGTSMTRALLESGPCLTITKVVDIDVDLRKPPNDYYGHLRIDNLAHILPNPKIWAYSIVRNPWDRYVALGAARHRAKFTKESFAHFMNRVKDARQFTQASYFDVDNLYSYVGQFENMEASWSVIQHRLDITTKLPHLNKSPHTHYSHYYTPELIKLVAELEAPIIEKFGYTYQEE